jgi:hypothetical protein
MSPGSAAKKFEAFARDCVQLAAQADTPELREIAQHGPRLDAGGYGRGPGGAIT